MAIVEELRVVHIGASGEVLAIVRYAGSACAIALPSRAIVADALQHGSYGLLLAHDHPGGDPTPSAADLRATRSIARLLRAIGVRLHDHLVFGHDSHVSFRASGLL